MCRFFQEMDTHFFKLLANESECLEDGISWTCHGHDTFWTGAVRNIDLGTRLKQKTTRVISTYGNPSPPSLIALQLSLVHHQHHLVCFSHFLQGFEKKLDN